MSAHIVEADQLFLIRANDKRAGRILGCRQLPDELDEAVRRILTRTQAKPGRLEPEREEGYRLISKETAFGFVDEDRPEYGVSLRIVRFAVGEGFENAATNLPADKFGPDELKEMHRMRQGIEASSRRLELNIGATELHSRKAAWVTQEVFARMVLCDFCAAVVRYVSSMPGVAGKRGRKHAHSVNFADAARVCCAFLRGRVRGPAAEELAAGSTSPIRPGRSFHRRHRLPPHQATHTDPHKQLTVSVIAHAPARA